jgi:hypothetical protein
MAGMATTDKNGIGLKLAWPSAEWGSLPIEGPCGEWIGRKCPNLLQ